MDVIGVGFDISQELEGRTNGRKIRQVTGAQGDGGLVEYSRSIGLKNKIM